MTARADKLNAITTAVLAATLAAWSAAAPGQDVRITDSRRMQLMDPPRAGVHYIDADGDGYGPGSPKGADADDGDAAVNTAQTVAAVDVRQLLQRRGYRPLRIIYVAPGGDDRMGRVDDEQRPFATWERASKHVRPGDAVLFRAGTYAGDYGIVADNMRGSEQRPIVVMAYPGETVVFTAARTALKLADAAWVVFDGLTFHAAQSGKGDGVRMHRCRDVVMRDLVIREHYWGVFGMQDLQRVLIERCVIHDNHGEHGIYLGARENPNADITIRRCVIYRNRRHGIQHNGRVRGLRVLDNVIHTNNLAGLSLIMGTSDSRVAGNLIFNNNKQGIVFYAYDDRSAAIAAYDQTGNVVEDNVIYVGRFSWNGAGSPGQFPGIVFTDSTAGQNVRMSGNVFRRNVVVTQTGACVEFVQDRLAEGNVFEGNVLYRAAGAAATFARGGKAMTAEAFAAEGVQCRDNTTAAPRFKDVSDQYYFCPGRFDFTIPASSPPGPPGPADSPADAP